MTLANIKNSIDGAWASIAIEVRPSAQKNADGTLKPFYLSRKFTYTKDDLFGLEIINYADAFGKMPLAKLILKGHVQWREEHAIVNGAYQVDFTADIAYEVTPIHSGFLELLNKTAVDGFDEWQLNIPQSILKKTFIPFGLTEGQVFKEYDLMYCLNNFLFWGARHIDGKGFDSEMNRPANLQIPMIRS